MPMRAGAAAGLDWSGNAVVRGVYRGRVVAGGADKKGDATEVRESLSRAAGEGQRTALVGSPYR